MNYIGTTLSGLSVFLLIFATALVLHLSRSSQSAWQAKSIWVLRVWTPWINLLPDWLVYHVGSGNNNSIMLILAQAGCPHTIKPHEFILSKWMFGICGSGLSVTISELLGMTPLSTFVWGAAGGLLGYFYLHLALIELRKKRYRDIGKAFPFFLDLLILALRSGHNLTMALRGVNDALPDSALKIELEKLLRDLRAGMSKHAALDSLAQRINQLSIKNFVAAIKQAELSGGEMAPILAQQAKQNLNDRFMRAEKLANEAPVKMLFPLVVFLFPLTLVVILFPILVKAIESGLLGMLQH